MTEMANNLCTFSSATREHYSHCFTSMQSNQHRLLPKNESQCKMHCTCQLLQLTQHSLWWNLEVKKTRLSVNYKFSVCLLTVRPQAVTFLNRMQVWQQSETLQQQLVRIIRPLWYANLYQLQLTTQMCVCTQCGFYCLVLLKVAQLLLWECCSFARKSVHSIDTGKQTGFLQLRKTMLSV